MTDLDDHTPEEIAEGTRDFVRYLEERDSQVCNYTWCGLMECTIVQYDFSKGKRDE